jgi:hypothetical protein
MILLLGAGAVITMFGIFGWLYEPSAEEGAH